MTISVKLRLRLTHRICCGTGRIRIIDKNRYVCLEVHCQLLEAKYYSIKQQFVITNTHSECESAKLVHPNPSIFSVSHGDR